MGPVVIAILAVVFVLVLAFFLVCLCGGRDAKQLHTQPRKSPALESFNYAAAHERLSAALQHPTVSFSRTLEKGDFDLNTLPAEFERLQSFLELTYPTVFKHFKRERDVGECNMVLTLEGTNPALKPFLYVAHQDVVPAGEPARWEKKPFSGTITGSHIIGRGALDDKMALVCFFEAMELLLAEGFKPARSIVLASSHCEELINARDGVHAMVEFFKRKNMQFELVMDEGGAIMSSLKTSKNVAMIGMAERRPCMLTLSVASVGGHGSLSSATSAIVTLSNAIAALSKYQFPANYDYLSATLCSVAPYLPFPLKQLSRWPWLLKLGLKVLNVRKKAELNAMVAPTVTPTILYSDSNRINVPPSHVSVSYDARLLPSTDPQLFLKLVKEAVNNPAVQVDLDTKNVEPSVWGDPEHPTFKAVQQSMHDATYGQVLVAPYLVPATSDSRLYAPLAGHHALRIRAYSFLSADDFKLLHGANERVRKPDVDAQIRFAYWVMKNMCENDHYSCSIDVKDVQVAPAAVPGGVDSKHTPLLSSGSKAV